MLETEDSNKPITFVAHYGTLLQITSALGSAFHILRAFLTQEGRAEIISTEKIDSLNLQKDQFSESLVIQVTTDQAIPYTFRLSDQLALDLAETIHTQAGTSRQVGSA